MANSLRNKIKHFCYTGELSESERDRLLNALESKRYKPIILQEHDAEPRKMRAIIDTATDDIYISKLSMKNAKFLGMTIEEVNADDT
jgi:hypothetical protein